MTYYRRREKTISFIETETDPEKKKENNLTQE